MSTRNRHRRPVATALLLVATVILTTFVPATRGATQAAGNTRAVLIQTIDTSQWDPPSPDPSGITYWPAHNNLLVVDGEVDEIPDLFTGDNIFEATKSGSLVKTYSTLSFSHEPVGVDIEVNPSNGHFFISDDNKKKVFEIDLGADGKFGTSDDRISSFSTSDFGDNDPEGLTLGGGKLYVTDGAGAEVYKVNPGSDGRFDGVPPAGDDSVSHFDTASLGQVDPEGIEYNPATGTLYLVSKVTKSHVLAEVTTNGTLLQTIDLGFFNPVGLSDVTLAPGSQNPAVMTLYLTDRGVDNNVDPNENDGKIYEISLQQTTNLLANPGFELDANGDNRPDSWTSNAEFTRSNVTPHGGSYVGKHFATDNGDYTISQTVNNLTAGTVYSFSGWVNIPATSDTFTFKLQVKWRDSSNSTISTDTIKTYKAATNGWDQVAFSKAAPAGTDSAQVMMKPGDLNATIYVDDFEFGP